MNSQRWLKSLCLVRIFWKYLWSPYVSLWGLEGMTTMSHTCMESCQTCLSHFFHMIPRLHALAGPWSTLFILTFLVLPSSWDIFLSFPLLSVEDIARQFFPLFAPQISYSPLCHSIYHTFIILKYVQLSFYIK